MLVTRVSGAQLVKAEWGTHEERESYADCFGGLITILCSFAFFPLSLPLKPAEDRVNCAEVGVPLVVNGRRWGRIGPLGCNLFLQVLVHQMFLLTLNQTTFKT